MRAAVTLPGEPWLEVREVPDPAPGPGDLLLRVEACGICGSDLHLARSGTLPAGSVYGHEFCGTVVALGPDTAGFREGDRVVGLPLSGCGRCPACRAGVVAKCPRALLTGAQRPGAYAEFTTLRATESFAVPEAVGADIGALVEPLAVAHHALERTPREPGEPVLVLGAGPIGLAVALWARLLGASEVVVSDPAGHRRKLARAVGATPVDPAAGAVAAAFAEIAGGPPRAVVECAGVPGVIQQAIDAAAPDAHVTVAGACSAPDTFRPLAATTKELTLAFAVYYRRRDFAHTLGALAAGRLDPAALITGKVGLDEAPDRFAVLMGANTDCKVLIRP